MAFLDIRDLHLAMRTFEGEAHVLNGINLSVERGEIWGLVGETGCGKSLTGLSISRLVPSPPGRYLRGEIRFAGQDLLATPEDGMRRLRGGHIGMIFQDPTTNLNPAFRIGEQMVDVALHADAVDPAILGLAPGASRRQRRVEARRLAIAMLDKVGVPDAARRIDDYPHQFSGGMRQRVLIAMALIGKPELLIADEPTTALDVSVQAQILRLIHSLVLEYQLAVLLITHNLGVVAQLCTHVAVMYAGNIIESGPVRPVFRNPTHPYTRALMKAVPHATHRRGELQGLPGSVPNLFTPPPGCRLAPRCPVAQPRCAERVPPTIAVSPGHDVACVLATPAGSAAA
ncbi:ABC transporter ATP-binding protein [Limobrevibacterium gyesilva]|uniref:ABC transporter ATP-binding protein n=1 Tax=Limobrevibacterium gyesilva TaxID=2991712 RepID=A0AA41YNN4_9PROT|nr:ABC transporter ATP-binding protein [Limobrevibacterium gyesilva]MCW3477231.1 ABC transporter ATP-binding protein [Limobrevibacterium gyesilva]